MIRSFNEWLFLQESNMWERYGENLPSMFRMTHYALPTQQQLDEFQNYPDLTADDIVQGFGYTIVGRGVNSPRNTKMIIDSIQMLADRYPESKTYKEALAIARERK